jgi:hypothetical protein
MVIPEARSEVNAAAPEAASCQPRARSCLTMCAQSDRDRRGQSTMYDSSGVAMYESADSTINDIRRALTSLRNR